MVIKASDRLQLTGSLQGLKQLKAADRDKYKAAIADGGQLGLAYYFPYLLTYNRAGRSAVLLAEEAGSVCVFLWKAGQQNAPPRLDLLLAPSPMNPQALRKSLERANTYNNDRSARILRVDAKDAEILRTLPDLITKERHPQYLYIPEAFADISGRQFRSMRRNVAKVEALDNLEVVPYKELHAEPCRNLLRRWQQHNKEMHGTTGGTGTSKRIIDLAAQLPDPDIVGEVIFIGDEVAGFAFGGEIRPGVGAFMEAKCDYRIQGLSYFQRYSFLSKLKHFATVNDGSDVGRPGLRELKNRLRPAGMHNVYRGYQTAAV